MVREQSAGSTQIIILCQSIFNERISNMGIVSQLIGNKLFFLPVKPVFESEEECKENYSKLHEDLRNIAPQNLEARINRQNIYVI